MQRMFGEYTPIKSNKATFKGKSCMIGMLMFIFLIVIISLLTIGGSQNKSNPASNIGPQNDIQSDDNDTLNNDNNDKNGHLLLNEFVCDANILFSKWTEISPPNDEYELLQSHYITRHGDRTQVYKSKCWDEPQAIWICGNESMKTVSVGQNSLYGFVINPIDNVNVLRGDCLLGELTPKGFKQLYDHGQNMRHRYQNYYKLIPNQLNHKNLYKILSQIRLRSDVSLRCQESVMAFFMGLYPNYNELKYQIKIPIYVEDDNYEIITDARSNVCPELEYIANDRVSSKEWMDFSIQIAKPINNTVADLLQNEESGFMDAFDCGTAHLCHGFHAPHNFTQELYDDVQSASLYTHIYQGQYPDYITATKYHIGPFLKLIYHRFKIMIDKRENINNDGYGNENISSLYIYGGHDTGPIIPLLSAFQYNLTHWVPYSATIVLELFQNKNDEYFILISYNGNPLQIPFCDYSLTNYNLCQWNLFQQWIFKVTPTMQECPHMKIHQYLTQNV